MQNDLFVTAMREYAIGEEASANGWGTIIKCVKQEYTDRLDVAEVKAFLRTQEKLYKQDGNTLPAAYRSAKSTLLKGIEYGVNIEQPKSVVYEATKQARAALDTPVYAPLDVFHKNVASAKIAFDAMGGSERMLAIEYLQATFGGSYESA